MYQPWQMSTLDYLRSWQPITRYSSDSQSVTEMDRDRHAVRTFHSRTRARSSMSLCLKC
jgi:hypothetical protein